MPWTYRQATGMLIGPDGSMWGGCYSGKGEGKNNPSYQNVKDLGPIPAGLYEVLSPVTSYVHGPFALPLHPDPTNQMWGRNGFMIHGDSKIEPGTASEGCLIASRQAREAVWNSGDHRLEVVSD